MNDAPGFYVNRILAPYLNEAGALLDAGASTDPVDRTGSATVLSDLVLRGAGERDNRTLTAYLDSLGLQRSSSVGIHHTRFGSAALAARVLEAIPTYGDIVRRPHMPEVNSLSGASSLSRAWFSETNVVASSSGLKVVRLRLIAQEVKQYLQGYWSHFTA